MRTENEREQDEYEITSMLDIVKKAITVILVTSGLFIGFLWLFGSG